MDLNRKTVFSMLNQLVGFINKRGFFTAKNVLTRTLSVILLFNTILGTGRCDIPQNQKGPGGNEESPDEESSPQIGLPEDVGPFYVGFQEEVFVSPINGAEIDSTTYYPATSLGENAAPDDSSAPYPVVVFQHGAGADKNTNTWVGQHLASWGYVVIMSTVPDGWEILIPSLLFGAEFDWQSWADTLLASLDRLEVVNIEPGILTGMLDLDRIGIAGHSLGANAVLRAGSDARIDAIVSLAPFGSNGEEEAKAVNIPDRELESLTAPIQFQIGTKDAFCPRSFVTYYYETVSSSHKAYYEIAGGTHIGFMDSGTNASIGSTLEWVLAALGLLNDDLGDEEEIEIAEQLRIAKRYTTSWFNYFLKDDESFASYIFGEEMQKELTDNVLTKVLTQLP